MESTNKHTRLLKLLDTEFREFIDFQKLVASPTFESLILDTVSHANEHGDHSKIRKLLEIFYGTVFHQRLVDYFNGESLVDLVVSDSGIQMSRNKSKVIKGLDLSDYLQQVSVPMQTKATPAIPTDREKIRKATKKAKHSFYQNGKSKLQDINFKAVSKLLNDTPAEYRAAAYRDVMNGKIPAVTAENKELLKAIEELEAKISKATSSEVRAVLSSQLNKLKALPSQKPRPKRKGSPILPGSYGSKQ